MSSNKENTNLSREEIQRYLSSTNEQEKRALEGKSLDNDFDSDALDGWSSTGKSTMNMSNLDKQFKPKISYQWLVYSGIAVVGVVTGVFFMMRPSEPIQKDVLLSSTVCTVIGSN